MGVRVSFADNVTEKLLATVAKALPHAEHVKFAVAFVSASGLSLMEPYLQQCMARGGRAEFLVGLDLLTTDPGALKMLHGMSEAGLPIRCFCYSDPFRPNASIYHPKVYVMTSAEETTVVVGSSNLTRGGLRDNVEVNTVIRADPSDEIVSDIHAVYNTMKFLQPRVEPDNEFISLYEALHRNATRKTRAALADVETRQLQQRLTAKASALYRPEPLAADLFGWQRIVFERLPIGSFRTGDVYAFEGEFERRYPENKNIRPKIRQVLQQLRDLGLITHVATNLWEKGQ